MTLKFLYLIFLMGIIGYSIFHMIRRKIKFQIKMREIQRLNQLNIALHEKKVADEAAAAAALYEKIKKEAWEDRNIKI